MSPKRDKTGWNGTSYYFVPSKNDANDAKIIPALKCRVQDNCVRTRLSGCRKPIDAVKDVSY